MTKGEDWSYAKSSARPDRPLSNAQLAVLAARSDRAGFLHLGLQYGQILAGALLIAGTGMFGRMLGMCLMGFGLVTMGHCAQHECIHNTAFRTRRINNIVSWLASLPRLTNPIWERMLHKDHHTYTNDPARDPEIMAGSPANALPGDIYSYVTKILRIGGGKYGLGVWSARVAILTTCAAGRIVGYSGFDLVPEKKATFVKADLQRSCRLQLGFYAAIILLVAYTNSWAAAAKYWLLPMLVGEPLHAFFHIADHLNCEHDYKNGRANTRTTPAPSFVRFNMWNMNYHAEHHLYPSIPFHQLPAAHDALHGHFAHQSSSAVSMHRDLVAKWIPHFQERLKFGKEKVETEWVPCAE
ncbi:unnamed protein product [Polarella glacialis]|uniref:Fatty acid desaturase domain-containing protein n=1 Tax=Polarella glacialis TaxID=89957 RepID=A0A813DTV9_POLGL|nr:unnamed protein product [Polarella glacialis]